MKPVIYPKYCYTPTPMDIRDEVRSRLPIDHVVSQYCQLVKKGRNFACICPFHNDKHPSFVVSPDKGIGWCFACQSGGDIFAFVQKIEGVDFPTALRILAERAGVEMPKDATPVARESRDAKERARECLQEALSFYTSQLRQSPEALAYLQKRGTTAQCESDFSIGYAPDSFSQTYDHLLKAGFSQSEILAAGLAVQKELEGRPYDRFRHRIMFPIFDTQAKLIGFGGRTIGADDAKYINSPDGPLYHKSSVLFGLSLAKEAIRLSKKVMLVEGYFDVVSCHKAGVTNVVAVSGTALTEEHVRILKRYADTVILCMDQDVAGQTAADRAFTLLAPQDLRIESVVIPAKDPDEYIQKDLVGFKDLVTASARPYLDAVVESLAAMPDIATIAGKRRVNERMFPLLAALQSRIERGEYFQKIERLVGAVGTDVHGDFLAYCRQQHTKPKDVELLDGTPFTGHALVLGLTLQYPEQRQLLTELIPHEDPQWKAVREAILASLPQSTSDEILAALQLDGEFKRQLQVLLLFCEENFTRWSESTAQREIRKLCISANKEMTVRKQMEIIELIKAARKAGSSTEEALLLTKYQQVLQLAKMSG